MESGEMGIKAIDGADGNAGRGKRRSWYIVLLLFYKGDKQ
jgi:hypothetical protein